MSETEEVFVTKTGRRLTGADIEALADEAERGYDVRRLRRRVNEDLGAMTANDALHQGIVMRVSPNLTCGSVSPGESATVCSLEPDHAEGIAHVGIFKKSYVSWAVGRNED